jgi:hypothetical protein
VLGECAADPYSFGRSRSLLLDSFFVSSFVCSDGLELVRLIIYFGGVTKRYCCFYRITIMHVCALFSFPDYWHANSRLVDFK